MKPELTYLTWVTLLTGLLWLPYILDRLMVRGIPDTVGYPPNPKPQSPWAARLRAAHANAVENLVVFAVLLLVANALGISNGTVAFAAILYFWARVVHVVAYTLAWPWVRTLAFAAGFVAQLTVALQILAR
ncbi:MAG TPA: MAPEG family protein [Casimicrobiaceae bacterium]|jgi:uncharacterized MAPEG superfamily protein